MKILFLYLSDIHTKVGASLVSRGPAIAKAAATLDPQVEACVLFLLGDIAFSGLKAEYEQFEPFLQGMIETLTEYTDAKDIPIVIIPGNHDCDLSAVHDMRELLIPTILKQNDKVGDETIEACTRPQNEFFAYLDRRGNTGLTLISRLNYEYNFDFKGFRVLINCYNSAWLSQNPEKPSQLCIPMQFVRKDTTGYQLVLSVVHHPLNWLSPENAREFRKGLEGISDIVITGHEHDYTSREQNTVAGTRIR